MGSMAKVKGLIDESQDSQFGMKLRGAKAVLAKSSGKLLIKITAISSIWPGKLKASAKLKAVTANISRARTVTTINNPAKEGHPYPKNPAAIMIAILWIRLRSVM